MAAYRDSAKADFKQVVDAALSKLRDELISQFSDSLSGLQAENEQLRRRLDEAESRRQPSVSPSSDEDRDGEIERAEAEPERAPRPPTPPRPVPTRPDRRADSRRRDRSPTRQRDGYKDERDYRSPRSSRGSRGRDGRGCDSERSRSPLERRQPAPPPARSLSRARGPKGSGKGKDNTLCFLYLVGKCNRNQCADRHPSKEESKALLDKMQHTSCKWGRECKRRDCVFWHPADRGSF
ncbi:unnamed protein product [Prorocentrum cordatum]|uniref:C3H1-type domain-containing protein n=1 Tax=Prorocentrum cordatum TaxID=2364126 RepID=A0ABN9T5B1_9DINO|nr:unnamed protein product [Polarella glacialis]